MMHLGKPEDRGGSLCRNKQFAVVENPGFWHWTFSLKDESGGTLAEIDRTWRGFGYEVTNFHSSFLVVELIITIK